MSESFRKASLPLALLPILLLICLLVFNVLIYGDDSSYGPNQIALLLAAAAASIIALRLGHSWEQIMVKIIESISSTTGAIIILLLIGALAGTWFISGIVPAMIYYGLNILNPTIFLMASAIICAIVSVATGSSWTTVATVGIALLGIGNALDIYEGWIAGAIISGAYFGDKMSPLSDTTNVASAVAGTDLFTHIRYMTNTTIPSIGISLLVFLVVGFFSEGKVNEAQIEEIQTVIAGHFHISPWLFLVPVIVIALILKKVQAIPALLIGTLLGGFFAIIFQPDVVMQVSGISDDYLQASYKAFINAMALDTQIVTSNAEVNELLSSGGMAGMMNTIWLIICALTFGGAMQAGGLLRRLTEFILQKVNSVAGLIGATSATCVLFNITASDQYLAIIVPGKMYADAYKDAGLAPENLSRTLEDSGTVTSALIPWNTCGAFHSKMMGVETFVYAPFAIFNWISPLMTILFAVMGWKIRKAAPIEGEE